MIKLATEGAGEAARRRGEPRVGLLMACLGDLCMEMGLAVGSWQLTGRAVDGSVARGKEIIDGEETASLAYWACGNGPNYWADAGMALIGPTVGRQWAILGLIGPVDLGLLWAKKEKA